MIAAFSTRVHDRRGFDPSNNDLPPQQKLKKKILNQTQSSKAVLSGRLRLVARQKHSRALIESFEEWLNNHRAKVSRKSPLGEALSYIAKYWNGLIRFLDDGRIELDNNSVERTIRPITLNRKNALFAGHDAGAENWAMIASLIETCKLGAINPHTYLATTLTKIAQGHKQSKINELLPWNFEEQESQGVV
ncbi:transposase [Pseudovibrio sp. Tun.PSC04-5.I4]|uniref:IS66 family transposase n=1 Tax=Pseudovibrio sp. Tun.PSC04-5.I4 TaxID=1798213 RepID=UPI00244E81C3|nr:transposase [Pseudovibrio sp. Tun.PSC04-5.I4]